MKTLTLTSPPAHGPQVVALQKLLNAKGYGPLQADGEYGPHAAAAVRRAKYDLGYPDSRIDAAAGDQLDGYLLGAKPLPLAYQARAAARARTTRKALTLPERALANLAGKLGVKEDPPNSNRCWATAWYGAVGPWCAMAVTWAYVTAGSTAFQRSARYAYVPYIEHDARAGVNGLHLTNDPQPGDLVIFDWDRHGVADHVGLFETWTHRGRGEFRTIEGNTAPGNDSNGGQVMRRERSTLTARVLFAHAAH